MQTKLVDISIIVPCRNEERYIKETIRRIVTQEGAGRLFNFELLIVDGKSTDNTVKLVEEKARKNNKVTLIINEKKTTPAAFNLGIKDASGKYICILGAHAEIYKDYLINCLNTIKKIDSDNVGGTWKAKGQGYLGKSIALSFQSSFAVGGARSHKINYEGYVDSVWGGFYKREVFDKIGLFDEELVRNQDDEFNLRLIRSGGKIWQSPEIKSWYCPRASIVALFKQYVQYGYWKVRVIQKHKIPASIRHIVPGMFVGLLTLLTVLSPFSQLSLKILAGLLAFYGAGNLGATFLVCKEPSKWKYIPVLPIIFSAYHFGYGYGFLRGILDFIVLKKRPGEKFTKLTRTEKG
jgi:glycosyltransferase involved in cell wall biosynthesis